MLSTIQRDCAVIESNEITDEEVDAAVEETLDVIEQKLKNEDTPAVWQDYLPAVETRLRHSAALSGGYLRGNWVYVDDDHRFVVVEGTNEIEISHEVMEDYDMDDYGITAGTVHSIFHFVGDVKARDVSEMDVVVVPVPAPLREVYW